MRQRYAWFCAVVLFAVLLMPQPAHAADTFTDPQGRFSFTAPDGYTQLTQQQTQQLARQGASLVGLSRADDSTAASTLVVAYVNEETGASVFIGAFPSGGEAVSSVTTAEAIRALQNLEGFSLDPPGIRDTYIDGQRALTYVISNSAYGFKARLYIVAHGENFYVITLGGPIDIFGRVTQEMIIVLGSFKFLS